MAMKGIVGITTDDYEEVKHTIAKREESFRHLLLRRIDEAGMTDAECYKKAHLNRSHFNRIKNNPRYKVQKETVIALGLALELDELEFQGFLARAGYALSYSNKSDIIIRFCIRKKIYDLIEVNDLLSAFQQTLLRSNEDE